jgi:multiple sugar transport system substrate-binding protein
MNARRFLIAVLLVAAVLISGCGPSVSRKTTIRFWNGFTGPDGRAMLAMVKRFNAENPDIQVIMQRMDWGTYYNKLFVAATWGRAPEVFVAHTDELPRFQSAALLAPLDDLMAEDPAWNPDDFDPRVWDSVAFDGRHYALPLDVHMLGLYYNRKLFRDAGLVDAEGNPTPPATREQFVAQLRRFRQMAEAPDALLSWGFVITWYRTNGYTLMLQNGGRFFTEDGTRCVLNNRENREALQFLVDLIHTEGLVPSPSAFDSWIGFRQGKVAMAFEGVYMLGDLRNQPDLDFAAAPAPVLGDHPAVWAASHNLCTSPGLDPEERAAARRFLAWLSDNSLDWAEAGQVPVRRSLRDSDRFRAMEVQQAFARQLDVIQYGPQIEFAGEFWREFDLAVELALRGTLTPEQALSDAERRINEVIARRGK